MARFDAKYGVDPETGKLVKVTARMRKKFAKEHREATLAGMKRPEVRRKVHNGACLTEMYLNQESRWRLASLREAEESCLWICPIPETHPPVTNERLVRLMADRGVSDLPYFAMTICGFSHNPDPEGPRMTEDQGELLAWLSAIEEHGLDTFLVLCPRDTLKSTCLQAYVLWRIVRNPNIRILLYGEVHEQAQKRLAVIKRVLETGRFFKLCYGDMRSPQWNEDMVTVATRTNRALRESTIETAGLDVVVNSRHFDLIIPDDLHSEKNTKTRDQIDGVKEKVALLQPLLSKGGKMLVAGVFWNDGDVHVQMSEDQAIERFIRSAFVDDEKKVPRYPHQLPLEVLAKKESRMPSDLFACHYLMDPVPKANAKFKLEYFIEIPRAAVPRTRNYLLIDPAGDPTSGSIEKRDSDYFGFVNWGVTEASDMVGLDFFRAKLDPTEAIEQAIAFILRYKPLLVGVETTGIGNMKFYLKEKIRELGLFAVVIDLLPGGRSKYDRIMQLEPMARTRRVFIVEDAQGKRDFYDEAIRFPKAKHDDLIDPSAYMIDILRDYGCIPMDAGDDEPDQVPANLRELNPASQRHWMTIMSKERERSTWNPMAEFLQ